MDIQGIKKGDIVKVRLRESPGLCRIGIVVNPSKKRYMVGNVLDVMVDGKVKRVKEEHIEKINKGD